MANPAMHSAAAELHRRFVSALNAGDVEALVALYEPDAVLVPLPGQPVRGSDEIRSAFAGLVAGQPEIAIETGHEFSSGDLVLAHSRWRMKIAGPDGARVEMTGAAAEVIRRQGDGRWLYVVDNPFASA